MTSDDQQPAEKPAEAPAPEPPAEENAMNPLEDFNMLKGGYNGLGKGQNQDDSERKH